MVECSKNMGDLPRLDYWVSYLNSKPGMTRGATSIRHKWTSLILEVTVLNETS